jgi:hypothetical protein
LRLIGFLPLGWSMLLSSSKGQQGYSKLNSTFLGTILLGFRIGRPAKLS